MGKGSAEVPGWSKLGLQWDEFEVLVKEIEASPAIFDAYVGRSHPLPTPSVRYDIGNTGWSASWPRTEST
jgi:hypothetical protein